MPDKWDQYAEPAAPSGDKWEQYAEPAAPTPAPQESKSLWDRVKDVVQSNTQPTANKNNEAFPAVKNVIKRTGRTLFGMVDTPVQNISHVVKGAMGDEQEEAKIPSLIPKPAHIDLGTGAVDPGDPMGNHELVSGLKESYGGEHGGTNLAGDVAAIALLHKSPSIASKMLEVGGDTAKFAGRKLGNVAIGASDDKAYGERPGAGVSGNRVVGMTPKSILRKVKAKIDPLAEARDQILENSPVEGMDIRRDVNEPFHTIRTAKTDPVTGGAEPGGIANLTMAQKVANLAQDPFTGQPTTQLKPLDNMRPAEAGRLNTNLRDMATYSASHPEGTLAEQALKGAGSNIRKSLAEAVPESVDATQKLQDTLAARDVLQPKVAAQESTVGPDTLFGSVKRGIVKPLFTGATTAAAAGLDLVGSGAKTLAAKIRPVGPPPAGVKAPDYGISTQTPPPPAGALPQFAGQMPGEPPIAPTSTTINPPTPSSSPIRTPDLELPAQTGIATPRGNPKPPPNVSLKERITADKPRGLAPDEAPPLNRPSGPTVGPEGPGQFVSSPRRLTDGLAEKVGPPKKESLSGRVKPDYRFYHGTHDVSKIDDILTNGLRPGGNGEGINSFMSSRPGGAPEAAARGTAGWLPEDSKTGEGAVIAIKAPRNQVIYDRMRDQSHGRYVDQSKIDDIYGPGDYREADTYDSKGKFAIQRDAGEFKSVVRTGGVPPEMIDRDNSYVIKNGKKIPLNEWKTLAEKVGKPNSPQPTVYHGGSYTGGKFKSPVIWVSPDEEMARSYHEGPMEEDDMHPLEKAKYMIDRYKEGVATHKFSYNAKNLAPEKVVMDEAEKLGMMENQWDDESGREGGNPATLFDPNRSNNTPSDVRKLVNRLKKLGYDGAHIESDYDRLGGGSGQTYVVFDPNQLKHEGLLDSDWRNKVQDMIDGKWKGYGTTKLTKEQVQAELDKTKLAKKVRKK